MFFLLLMLLAGTIIGNVLASILLLGVPGLPVSHITAIAYVIMFIPPMIASRSRSNREFMSGNTGYALDNNNFKPAGVFVTAALCMLATIGGQIVLDPAMKILPPMPEMLKKMLEKMTDSDSLLVNFITLSIFAPFFEEWLCRGMVLRGLLHYRRRKDSEPMKPVWAIVISAAFFAFIHMNPWQAIPAFMLGLLFGYVYYRTGSLKLTMLMHFTNNTVSLVLSNIDYFKDSEYLSDVVPGGVYAMLMAASIVFILLLLWVLSKTGLPRKQGNFEELSQENMI